MLGRSLIGKIGASAIAAVMSFGVLSSAMAGNVVLAEENVTETVTEAIDEVTEVSALSDKEERVTVSGNIVGYTSEKPIEIGFSTWAYISDEDDEPYNDVVTTEAKDGHYSVQLLKDCSYSVYLPGADGYYLFSPDNERISIRTFDEDVERDIQIEKLYFYYSIGEILPDDVFDAVDDTDFDEFIDACKGCVITFESDDFNYEEVLDSDTFAGPTLPVGEYLVTLKGKTGNVYSLDTLSLHWYSDGYVDESELYYDQAYSTYLSYGDYRTRDNEARIVCRFGDADGADLSNATFYFVDSNNNRTNSYSYLELKYGIIRLPNDKTYKLVAEGLPEGYVIDYSKMSDICPGQEHCGDAWYDYDVKVAEGSPYVPLAITKDTEDIAATQSGKKYTFKIEAEGTDLSYSWYMKKPGASKFFKAGIYTNEFSLYAKTNNDGIQVYCVIKDGSGNKLVGRTATFVLDYPAPVITYPNGKEISAASGKKANFCISAKSDFELTYSWYYMIPASNGGDGKFHKAGCYTDTYTRSAGKRIDGMQAYCLVTDSKGKKVKSDAITFKLK